MRDSMVAATVFAFFLAQQTAFSQHSDSTPEPSATTTTSELAQPATHRTQREKDELNAGILMATKRYAEAAEVYEMLAKQYPGDASYLNFAGIARIQRGDVNGAKKLFERAVKVDKNFADALSNLGTIWFSKKNYGRAIRQYEKAIQLRPDTAGYYTNLGYAYFNQKKIPQAFEMFHRAVVLDPGIFERVSRGGSTLTDRTVSNRGLFNFLMAKAYAQVGDAARCALYLRKAAEEGYKEKEMAKVRSDPAFASVLEDPEVQAVLDRAAPLTDASAAAPSS